MKYLVIITCATMLTLSAWAHSGGTNAAGCHYDHKYGGYHCH